MAAFRLPVCLDRTFLLYRFTCDLIDGRLHCLLVSVCMARNVSTSRSLSCGIVVNVLLSLSRSRRGSVPDCGCKITTLSGVLQIILCYRAYFSKIRQLYHYISIKSINVKISFILLTNELFTVLLRYSETEMSRKKRADKESARFFFTILMTMMTETSETTWTAETT